VEKVHAERSFAFGADAVWQKWSDISGIYKFHPLISRSPVTSAVKSGLGTDRSCYFHDGNEMTERVVEYDAGKRRMNLSMDAAFMPIKNATAEIYLISLLNSKTKVKSIMSFEPKFGVLGTLLASLVLKPKMKGMLNQLLSGLDTHLTTGDRVGVA